MRRAFVIPVALALACSGAEAESGASASAGSTTSAGATMTATSDASGEGTSAATSSGESESASASASASAGETTTTRPGTHTLGGVVEGLQGAGLRLVHQGGDPLEIVADGPFTFPAPLADGDAYEVVVDAQPAAPDQTCTITDASGTIAGADVDDLVVRCRTPIRHVVVIGVDGLGGTYLAAIDPPVLAGLRAAGVSTTAMQNVLPTMSAPNWMSMIAGSTPDQHGVMGNGWSPGDSEPTPTIFAVAREHLPGAKIGVFHDWDAFDDQVHEVPPPTQAIRCVHRAALRRGAASLIWNDAGSGAWENAGLWRCGVGDEGGVASGTFVTRRHHSDPGAAKCWVLGE